MRCLTLADALKEQGNSVSFICREHKGNLIQYIEEKGYLVNKLDMDLPSILTKQESPILEHAKWLGSSQNSDSNECRLILKQIKPDWLIVDHYALDYRWQQALKPVYKKLMVIDDLADRNQQCDLLLDQTYNREQSDYLSLVPKKCTLLLGSQNALLRPEFAQWRDYSLRHRNPPILKQLLITMGGVDANNITGKLLEALKSCELPKNLLIIVVMGETAPHKDAVKLTASTMPVETQVKINVKNMAEIMSNSDMAIGASGATAWERCCLGLPTISIVLAKNQQVIAEKLASKHSIWLIQPHSLVTDLKNIFSKLSVDQMREISTNAKTITDGLGVTKVLTKLLV